MKKYRQVKQDERYSIENKPGQHLEDGDQHHNDDGHDHDEASTPNAVKEQMDWKTHWDLLMALGILTVLLVAEYTFRVDIPNIPLLIIHLIAYILAGKNVFKAGFSQINAR